MALRAYIFFSKLLYILPSKPLYILAAMAGEVYYWTAREHSRNADRNMQIVLGEPKINRRVREVARRSFRNYSKYMVDFLRQQHNKPGEIEAMTTAAGWHYLDQCLESGKGAMLVCGHYGNWDAAAAVAMQYGITIYSVAKDFEPPELNELVQGARRRKGLVIYSPEGALRGLYNALKKNEIVVLLIDSPVEGEGVVVDFFGKPARFAAGPAMLASRTGSPIMLGYVVRQPGDTHFYGAWHPPLEYELTGNREQDILIITQEIARTIEAAIRRHPDQWYMFRKLWLDEAEIAERVRRQSAGDGTKKRKANKPEAATISSNQTES